MTRRSPAKTLLTLALILALPGPWYPSRAETPSAGLSGVIRDADLAPLEGARLLAADPESGQVVRSAPSTRDGNFALTLEPGTYELAVEVEGGLYLMKSPMELVAGINRPVQIAVGVGDADPTVGVEADGGSSPAAASVWNNPASAGALVLGLAVVVGILVKNATDDELNATNN